MGMNDKIIPRRLFPALLLIPAAFLAPGCMMDESSRLVGSSEESTWFMEGFVGDSAVMMHELKYRVDKYESNIDEWTRRTLLKSVERVYDFKAGKYGAEVEAPEYGIFFVRGNSFYFGDNYGDGSFRRFDLVGKKTYSTDLSFRRYAAVSDDDSLTYTCADSGSTLAFRGRPAVHIPMDALTPPEFRHCPAYRILVRDGQWCLYSGASADSIDGLIVSRDGTYRRFSIPGKAHRTIYVRGYGEVPYALDQGLPMVPAFFDPDGKLAAEINKVTEKQGVPVIEVDLVRHLSLTNHEITDLETGEIIYPRAH